MMDEYTITKVKDGKIVAVPFSEVEREIVAQKLSSLERDLGFIEEKIQEMKQEYFFAKLMPKSASLSDAVKDEISAKFKFTAAEIAKSLREKFGGAYAEGSYYSTTYAVCKKLLNDGMIRELDGGGYVNVEKEEKVENAPTQDRMDD